MVFIEYNLTVLYKKSVILFSHIFRVFSDGNGTPYRAADFDWHPVMFETTTGSVPLWPANSVSGRRFSGEHILWARHKGGGTNEKSEVVVDKTGNANRKSYELYIIWYYVLNRVCTTWPIWFNINRKIRSNASFAWRVRGQRWIFSKHNRNLN